MMEEEYRKELLQTWTDFTPNQSLTKQIVIEGYAISLLNMVKIPPVMVKSLETSLGIVLNDYYTVYDAAFEDHEV